MPFLESRTHILGPDIKVSEAHFVWSWLQNGQFKVSCCLDICFLDLYLHV